MPRFRALTDVDSAPLWSVSSLSAWLSLSKPIFYLLWLLVLRHTRSCIYCIPWDCWTCFPSLVISLINFGNGPSPPKLKNCMGSDKAYTGLSASIRVQWTRSCVVWRMYESPAFNCPPAAHIYRVSPYKARCTLHCKGTWHVSFVKSVILPMPRLPQTFEWTQYACAYALFAIPI